MASLLMPCGLRRFGRPTWRRRHSRPGAAPHAVMEAALSHVVRNKVEAAYARSDLFERRRILMIRCRRAFAIALRAPSAENFSYAGLDVALHIGVIPSAP